MNGHLEHAYPLTAEMLVTFWPLPNGTRLLPRLLFDAPDGPNLGEAAIIFNLSRSPAEGVVIAPGGSLPGFVLIFLAVQIRTGLGLLAMSIRSVRRWRIHSGVVAVPVPQLQLGAWLFLLLAVGVCLFPGKFLGAMLLLSLLFSKHRKVKS